MQEILHAVQVHTVPIFQSVVQYQIGVIITILIVLSINTVNLMVNAPLDHVPLILLVRHPIIAIVVIYAPTLLTIAQVTLLVVLHNFVPTTLNVVLFQATV